MEQVIGRQQDNNNLMIFGGVVGVAVVFYILNKGSNHSGRQGFPCYCKKCEETLVQEANNGDPNAMRKLAMAVEGGAYKSDTKLGPLALIVGLVVLVFIVSRVGKLVGMAPGRQFLEGGLRGR